MPRIGASREPSLPRTISASERSVTASWCEDVPRAVVADGPGGRRRRRQQHQRELDAGQVVEERLAGAAPASCNVDAGPPVVPRATIRPPVLHQAVVRPMNTTKTKSARPA